MCGKKHFGKGSRGIYSISGAEGLGFEYDFFKLILFHHVNEIILPSMSAIMDNYLY